MKMKIIATLALVSIAMLPFRVVADPDHVPPGQLYRSLENGSSRPAGTVRGVIESVDYSSGMIFVRAGGRNAAVAIVPSTTIYGGGQYVGISDLRRGQSVEIAVYEVDGRLIAQSIRLK